MPVSRKIYRLAPKTGYSIAADPLKKTSPRGLLYFAQLDLYADRTSTATMRANQLRPVRVSVRRIKIAMASGCPAAAVWGAAALRLDAAATARGSSA
jgi:hypothetical protein